MQGVCEGTTAVTLHTTEYLLLFKSHLLAEHLLLTCMMTDVSQQISAVASQLDATLINKPTQETANQHEEGTTDGGNTAVSHCFPSNHAALIRSVPDGTKYIIHFRPIGDAPQLRQYKYKIAGSARWTTVNQFLAKFLWGNTSVSNSSSTTADTNNHTLYLYVNGSFMPSSHQLVYYLFSCFAVNNELIVHYAIRDVYG